MQEIPQEVLDFLVDTVIHHTTWQERNTIRNMFFTYGTHAWIHQLDEGRGHFGWGMAMRNAFRRAGVLDTQLPSGNWDDYYIEVIEYALDLRTKEDDDYTYAEI